jgi:hypothetical protein
MSQLITLRDKDPKEVARLLSAVSRTLLPNPGVGAMIQTTGADPEFVRAVLSEIRRYLKVREGDQSTRAYTRIFAFLSEEISRSTLPKAVVSNVKTRLGNRGELRPSQYEVKFSPRAVQQLQALGSSPSHVEEAVTHPDKVVHLKSKYLPEGNDPRVTVSMKLIPAKRTEDNFILLVLTERDGHIQNVRGAFRVYYSDVNIHEAEGPIELLRLLVNSVGLDFNLGDKVFWFMHHETVKLEHKITHPNYLVSYVKPIGISPERSLGGFFFGGQSHIKGPLDEHISEIVLGFMIDMTEYIAILRKHHVHLRPDVEDFLAGLVKQQYSE